MINDPLAGLILSMLVLFALLPPLLWWCQRDPIIGSLALRFIIWRLFVFCFLVLWVLPYYASDGADAIAYHYWGLQIAEQIRQGKWLEIPLAVGSPTMNLLTGLIYTPFGGNLYAMYLLSAVLGMYGAYNLYKAFELWTNARNARLYALLLFFTPSFSTWTSIHGKDSWINLGLGLASYGLSLWLKGSAIRGVGRLAIGLGIISVIRPHIAILVISSILISQVFSFDKNTPTHWFLKAVRIAVMVPLLVILVPIFQQFIGLQDVNVESVLEAKNNFGRWNEVGGSATTFRETRGIAQLLSGLPVAAVNVLFRPFIWEAHNANSFLAAVENIFILIVLVANLKHVRAGVAQVLRQPYLAYAMALSFEFLLVFGTIPNLGLLSRFRAQLLPFLFTALCSRPAEATVSGPRQKSRKESRAHPPRAVPAYSREARI